MPLERFLYYCIVLYTYNNINYSDIFHVYFLIFNVKILYIYQILYRGSPTWRLTRQSSISDYFTNSILKIFINDGNFCIPLIQNPLISLDTQPLNC